MDDASSQKTRQKYHCKKCDYICSRLNDFNKHKLTLKHLKETKELQKDDAFSHTGKFICDCGNEYKHRQGLWKHKKKCDEKKSQTASEPNSQSSDIKMLTNMVMDVVKQNQELTNKIVDICKNTNSTNISNSNINSHNKTFNLNVFLNEQCKDAMNIMDFVDSLKLQLADLEAVGKLGYVEGISNIIVKNLKALDVHKRPVHCSDSKREVMYIKDEDKWEKENEEKNKLRKVIKKIANKNSRLLPQFKEKHPDCGKSDSLFSDQYNKLIIEAMGGSGDNDLEKEDKIIRKIAKEVTIDKSIDLID
jgi:hypothetical protein